VAVKAGQVAVDTTAGGTVIVPAANANWNPSAEDLAPSRCVVLSNGSGATVFLGPEGVTTDDGCALAASTVLTVWLHPDEALYGIVASTGSTVSYLESGS
jgi:hypothetical protein